MFVKGITGIEVVPFRLCSEEAPSLGRQAVHSTSESTAKFPGGVRKVTQEAKLEEASACSWEVLVGGIAKGSDISLVSILSSPVVRAPSLLDLQPFLPRDLFPPLNI